MAAAGTRHAVARYVPGGCAGGRPARPQGGDGHQNSRGTRGRQGRRPRPGTSRPGSPRRRRRRRPRHGHASAGRVRCPDDSPGTSWTLTCSCTPRPAASHEESRVPASGAGYGTRPPSSVGRRWRADGPGRLIALVRCGLFLRAAVQSAAVARLAWRTTLSGKARVFRPRQRHCGADAPHGKVPAERLWRHGSSGWSWRQCSGSPS